MTRSRWSATVASWITTHGPTASEPEGADRWRAVLHLWMRWNEAHERLCSQMYEHGDDLQLMENRLDQLDLIRQQALRATRDLLDS